MSLLCAAIAEATVSLADDGLGPPTCRPHLLSLSLSLLLLFRILYYQQPDNFFRHFSPPSIFFNYYYYYYYYY